MKILSALAALLALAWPSLPLAQQRLTYVTGDVLYERLKDWRAQPTREIVSASIGFGFVIGIHDALNGRGSAPGTCFNTSTTAKVTQLQLIDLVLAWLEENPQQRRFAADNLVSAALMKSYPCERG